MWRRAAWLLSLGLSAVGAATAQPTLILTNPGRNTNAMAPGASRQAAFDQNLSAGSPAGVKVFSARRGGRKAGTASVAANALTFDPSQDFLPGEVTAAPDRAGAAKLLRGAPSDRALVLGRWSKPGGVSGRAATLRSR